MLKQSAVVGTVSLCFVAAVAMGGDWPQFRGPNSISVATGTARLPAEVGPEKNVVWKAVLPPGHSSPVVVGDRVYVTGERDGKLLTIALDRATGKPLWEVAAPHEKLEEVHNVGNHAQATPAATEEHVYSFFGSGGLFCHDREGNQVWHLPMGPFKNDFGAGSSPVIDGERIILNQDHDTDSFLMSVDKNTGSILWKTDRSEFPRNYATPVVWTVEGKKQIVVPATLRIAAYDYDSGKELWTVHGVARIINMSPSIGPDGTLYVPCWSPGGDPNDRITTAPFDELISGDKNANGTLELAELPEGQVKTRFSQVDRDKSGGITRDEFESMRRVFETAKNVLLAIKPGGQGDITATHVKWKFDRNLPYCPSPVLTNGHLFMVKNGGIVTSVNVETGELVKEGRIKHTGDYYASPVAGDGKIYLVNSRGLLTVLSAEGQWKALSTADFAGETYATPALADGRVYLRTGTTLYCLGEQR